MYSRLSLLLSVAVVVALLGYMYADSLAFLGRQWLGSDDYSHGLFVPLISGFLAWRARHRVAEAGRAHSWWGPAVLAAGFLLYMVGEWSTLYALLHVSLWLVIVGLVMSLVGLRGAMAIGFPLGYLLTATPLPAFFSTGLSGRLQLWSSAFGVGWLQLVGVMAFREGNVIDLGPVQLQVVEACSGIRYLLPLASLALLCAYLFNDRMWKRVALVVSSLPITILTNGFRIGMVGVLIEWYGKGAADGFFHFFEGWVVFMAGLGLLMVVMWGLAVIGTKRRPLHTLFTFPALLASGLPRPVSRPSLSHGRRPGPAYLCSVALLVPMALASTGIVEREEVPPPRAGLVDFPMELQGWRGTAFPLEQPYIEALRFDDYVLADYRRADSMPVNLYVAYYGSQRKGQSAHSPQSCIPGGGWEITSLDTVDLDPVSDRARPTVNRVVIQQDDRRQIVLYWFKQRHRILHSEYLVKAFMAWDAMTRGRTDGALVRLTTAVEPGETEAAAEQRVIEFARLIPPALLPYVPD